jgi:hypothetical protein
MLVADAEDLADFGAVVVCVGQGADFVRRGAQPLGDFFW